MTDSEIDKLTGRDLDSAVARADGADTGLDLGLIRIEGYGIVPLPHYHSDLGMAMSLLLTLESGRLKWDCDTAAVWCQSEILASGQKSDAASVICRAWLKSKGRKLWPRKCHQRAKKSAKNLA